MNFDLRTLGTTASALVLALAMVGCGGGGGTAEAPPTPPPPVPDPEPVPPTDAELAIDAARAAAAAAATAAETAADSAEMAAAAAEMASMNRAAIQTGEGDSVAAAMKARMYADTAAAAAMEAAEQSAAAAATSDVTAAVAAKVAAEAAQATAEAAVPMAESYQAMAEADAMSELMIDDKTKSVGESTLTIDDVALVETPAAPDTPNKTGFQSKLTYTTTATPRVFYGAGPPVVTEQTGVASRSIPIGLVYDSSDDKARIHLVHSYDTVQRNVRIISGIGGNVTFTGETTAATTALPASKSKTGIANVPDTALPDYAATRGPLDVTLTPVAGVFYRVTLQDAGGAITTDVEGTIQKTAKAVPVYSFKYTTDAVGTAPGVSRTVMVALMSSGVDANGVATYTYAPITEGPYAPADATATETGATENAAVSRTSVPVAKKYEHLHFGVWTDTKDNPFLAGENLIDSRGTGFVADAGGAGMTSDMPTFGDASYQGNWVAAVQAAHVSGAGGISVQSGRATMGAHFERNTVAINLAGLASLSGKIAGNTFSGDTNATIDAANSALTAAGGPFTGTVNGAFFGPRGAEAGGVFDYDSLRSVGGAFRGAFGAARQSDTVIE